MVWNRIEDGMERNRNFGMEYGRCQNGIRSVLKLLGRRVPPSKVSVPHRDLEFPHQDLDVPPIEI